MQSDETQLEEFVKDFYGIGESFSKIRRLRKVDQPYLPDYETVIGSKTGRGRRILFVKSRMGTGKTVQNLAVTKRYPSHLIVSPRITLSQSLKSHRNADPETVLYSSITGPLSHVKHPKLICQFQSLHRVEKIFETEMFAKWKVLILDEIDALLNEKICGNTMTANRRSQCQTVFRKLINGGAELIVVSDAYLAKWHYEFITKRLLIPDPEDEITALINVHPGALVRFKSIEIYPVFSLGTEFFREMESALVNDEHDARKRRESQYVFRLNKRLSRGVSTQERMFMNVLRETFSEWAAEKRICDDGSYAMFRDVIVKRRKIAVVCTTKRTANITADFFTTYCGLRNEKDVLLVTGDREDRTRYLKRVSRSRVLIYSSCIKVGVDFNECFFDAVYVLVSKIHPLSLSDVVQMIGRVRQFDRLAIALEFEDKQWLRDDPLEYRSPGDLVTRIVDLTKTVIMIKDEERRINKSQPNFLRGLVKVITNNAAGRVALIVKGRKLFSVETAFSRFKPELPVQDAAKYALKDYGAFVDRGGEFLEAATSTILTELQERTFVGDPECVRRFLNLDVAAERHEKLRELYYFSGCVNSLAGIVTLMAGANDEEMERICVEEFEDAMCVDEDGLISGNWSYGNELPTPYHRITGAYRYLKRCVIRIKGHGSSTTEETKRIALLTHKITDGEFGDVAAMRELHRFFLDEVLSDNNADVVQNVKDYLVYDTPPPPRIDINKFLLYFSVN